MLNVFTTSVMAKTDVVPKTDVVKTLSTSDLDQLMLFFAIFFKYLFVFTMNQPKLIYKIIYLFDFKINHISN